jgi:opacity protein-like surface antigen
MVLTATLPTMRSILLLAASIAVLTGCSTTTVRQDAPAPPPIAMESLRQLNFGVGARMFDDEGFGKLDDHVAWTLDYCEPMGFDRLRLEGSFHYTHDEADGSAGGEDVDLDADTYELSVGVNYSHQLGRVRPYVGAGVSILWLEVLGIDEEFDLAFHDDDSTVGGYAKAGLLLQVTPSAHVGLEFRHFEGGDASFEQTELETSYDQIVFLFGTSFVTADPNPPHPARGY